MRQLVYMMIFICVPGVVVSQISYSESFYSQTFNIHNIQSDAAIEIIDGVATMRYAQHEHLVKGSPYLYDEFLFGVMSTVEAVRIEGLKYRYDIYSDEMQFILNNDTASITKPLTLRSIEIGQQKFIYDVYQTGENSVAAGYFEVLSEGRLSVLLRREKELDRDSYTENYGGGGGTKDFFYEDVKKYYLKHGEDVARRVKNRKSYLEIIPDHKEEIKRYMKAEKISTRKKADLQQVTDYYNSLVPEQSTEHPVSN